MTNLFKKAIALSLALLFGLYASVAPLHIEAVARPGDPAQAELIFDVPKFLDQYNGGVEYVHKNVWSLTKTATPTTLNLLHGTQGSVNFVVTATKQTTSSFSITYYVYIEYPTQTFDGDVVFDLQAVLSNPSGSNVFATETVENDYVLHEGDILAKNYTTTFTLPGDANASMYSPMKIAITIIPQTNATAQTTKSAAITFKGAPSDIIDEILYVYDDMYDNPANDPYDWMFTETGSVNYNKTFSAGAIGQQSFTNTVTGMGNDGGTAGPASATVIINTINAAPVANNDNYSTNEDTLLSVAAPGVLLNDSDPDGDALHTVLVSGPTHGVLMLNADGSFTYMPDPNYFGSDSFTYKANDGFDDSNVATVSINVGSVNDAPVALNDAYSIDEDGVLSVPALGVLGNDTDTEGSALSASLVTGVSHGILVLNSDGSFTYTPNANYFGSDSFTYQANDGLNDSNIATVTLTVNPINDAPVAVDDNYATDEDVALVVPALGVLVNDSDIESDILSAILVSGVSHGVLVLNADGSFTYTPNANYFGPDSFTYKANDGQADSNTVTVSITVRPINDAPVAVEDNYSIDEDLPLIIALPGVLGNDTDVESDILSAILVSDVAHGTLTLNANGSFTYVPNANYFGPDSFTYKANDGAADSNTVTVSITVNPVNDAPVAVNDNYSTDEDELLVVALPGVLGNDTDVEMSLLTAILVSDVAHGTLTLNADGSFSYMPAPNFFGSDSFTYKANDGSLDSNIVTVTINVGSVNDAPVAVDDSYSVDEDNVLTVINPNGVLANDSDNDMDILHAVLLVDVAHGTLVLNMDGTFTYTPDANYFGPDSFTYQAHDGLANSNVATVNITVNPINDAPVANNDNYSTDEDTLLNIPLPGVLGNDTDVEGSVLSPILVSDVAHGTLTLNADGSFTYLPAPNFTGNDSFTYKVNDGTVDSNVATVTINVGSVNDAPVAVEDSYSIDEDTLLTIAVPGVLGNDTDNDGDLLTVTLITNVAHGTLALNADGSFTYLPAANYFGPDSFTYQAHDGLADSNIVTVSITVNPINDAPVANNDYYETDEDTPITIPAPGFYANDVDPDNAIYHNMYNFMNVAGYLDAPFGQGGTFTYTPALNFTGLASFMYQIYDGQYTSQAYIYITVNPVNDAPVAEDDSYIIDEDNPLSVPAAGVMDNDSDVDGPSLNVSLLSDVSNGTLVLNPDGSFEYTPDANFNGVDSFTYTLTDGTLTDTATVTITINAINDAPVAEDDAYSTNEDVQLVIAAPGILGNDVDVDSIFSIDSNGQPANGTVVVQPDGSFVYTPNANFNGVDSFVYEITDGEHSDTATVTITVNPINDVPTADNKTLTVAEGGAGNGLFTGLDGDGDVLTFKILTQPVNGTVSFNATTGAFTYTHNGGETTSDTFTYAVNDGKVDSAAATVSITVTPVNDAPTAAGATYTVQIGSVFSRNFIRGDADGDPLTISIVNGPDRGSVSIAGGQFTYTHDGVTLDSDFFTFRVYDGQAYSPIRTIRVNFTALPFVNTAPEVENATFETEFETSLNETIGDLGSDFDNDPLTFTLVTQAAHGTVTLNADGTFRYVPDNDYEGDDSFTYKANDGTDDSNIATVTITVGEEIIVDPEPTPEATLPWWWLLGLLPFLLFLIRRPRPEVQDVALNPDGTITTTWGYLGPRLMHKDYDRDESILEVVSGEVKVLPPVEKVPYEFDRGRHENIFKTVSDKNAVIRWTIKKKAEELDKELIEKMLKKNQK